MENKNQANFGQENQNLEEANQNENADYNNGGTGKALQVNDNSNKPNNLDEFDDLGDENFVGDEENLGDDEIEENRRINTNNFSDENFENSGI